MKRFKYLVSIIDVMAKILKKVVESTKSIMFPMVVKYGAA